MSYRTSRITTGAKLPGGPYTVAFERPVSEDYANGYHAGFAAGFGAAWQQAFSDACAFMSRARTETADPVVHAYLREMARLLEVTA